MFNDSYVLVKLDTQERGEKEPLENPGADKLMADWGGTGGLPYIVILNARGEKIADSNRTPPKNANIGCPASPEEVEAFKQMLKETAPRVTEEQLTKLGDYFIELNKKK
jgi:hypothetical protein